MALLLRFRNRGMMNDSIQDLLRGIERNANEAAAREREVVAAGPFTALLNPSTDLIWLNYAVPTAPLGDRREVTAALMELRGVFAAHRRTLRFEFIEALWPDLATVLEDAGLRLQERHPLMLCAPGDIRSVHAPGVTVRLLAGTDDDAQLALYSTVQAQGFGYGDEMHTPAADEITRLRRQIEENRLRCALARYAGAPAGAGCTTLAGGTAELAGVATLPALRRRGVAVTLSSVLAQDHFERGGRLVWLSAADAAAQAVYTRIGFHEVGARLNYIDSL